MSGEASSGHGAWGFLQSHFLVVPVNGLEITINAKSNCHRNIADLFRVNREWSFTFAVRTVTNLDLSRRVLVEWSQNSSTFAAIELDVFQLGEHAASSRHNPGNTDKIVQVSSTKVSQARAERKVGDADVDLGVNALV
jgi:hypothetical protein